MTLQAETKYGGATSDIDIWDMDETNRLLEKHYSACRNGDFWLLGKFLNPWLHSDIIIVKSFS